MLLLMLAKSVGGASEGPDDSYGHVRVGASFLAARFSPRQVIIKPASSAVASEMRAGLCSLRARSEGHLPHGRADMQHMVEG